MKTTYEIENRATVHAQALAGGKIIIHENITDLDENKRPTNCYVIVQDAPPTEEDETSDLLEAAAIMGLEPEEG